MVCTAGNHRPRTADGRCGVGVLAALLLVAAVPCAACRTGSAASPPAAAPNELRPPAGPVPEAAGEDEASAGEAERTIGGRRFVRRGEDWYLESGGRWFRVLPDSLSIRFREGTSEDQRREFLDSRGFEVVRGNRLGILDLRTGSERHAVDWLAELADHELLSLIEVNTEGTYDEEE